MGNQFLYGYGVDNIERDTYSSDGVGYGEPLEWGEEESEGDGFGYGYEHGYGLGDGYGSIWGYGHGFGEGHGEGDFLSIPFQIFMIDFMEI